MKKLATIFALLTVLISMGAFAQKTWTGTTSTAWTTSTNWSPSGAPTAGDNVTIPSAPANQPTISGTSTPVCNNLTINSGASLAISSTMTNEGMLTASGNAIINGSLSFSGIQPSTLKAVNFTWGAGSSMSGAITGGIHVSGNWEFAAGSAVSMGFSTVTFTGSNNSTITSNSANSNFNGLVLNKTGGATVYIGTSSTSTLTINGGINIGSGAVLNGQANITTILKGNLVNAGNIYMGSGILSFEKTSGTQSVQINTNDFFNTVRINSGGTVTISTSYMMQLTGSMVIQSGVLDPDGNNIGLFGDWTNSVGTAGFTEGSGTVIFNGGNYHQYCSTETFNILEVHKASGGAFRVSGTGTTVTCAKYNWTAGSIDVLNNGTFTALDLYDQGIRGNYYVNTGCTINLHQDALQYVDLGGNFTFTNGGTINVYGGNGTVSQWPTYANASITMNGGTLDFKDQSITINTLSGYTLTTNITGGIIRTPGTFFCNRSDFNPAGGTIEMHGSSDSYLEINAGSLWSLEIDKNASNSVTLNSNLTLNGNLTVNSGAFSSTAKLITLANTLNINNGGVFHLGNAGQLKLASGKYLNVNSGGLLKTEGSASDNANITHSAGYYFISVKSGGTISSKYTYFQYLNYLQLLSGSVLDPANAFYKCTFTNNSAAPSGAVLSFANDQVVSIHEANFPVLNSGYNVYKSNSAGHVYFKDATGAFAGASYENDPYNRIEWNASIPGLWTGTFSDDWHTTGNWDNLVVPAAATNVTIPSGVANMPVINAAASCNNLTVNGSLSIGNAWVQVGGNFNITGTLAMNAQSVPWAMTIQGDANWNSGSTTSLSDNALINVYGNWNFNSGSNAIMYEGAVVFKGTASKNIYSYSSTSAFNNLYISKTGGGLVRFSNLSTQALKVNGDLKTDPLAIFNSLSNEDIIVKGDIISNGTIQCTAGAVKLDGTTQTITPNSDDYFNDLIFSQASDAYINNQYTDTLNVKHDIRFEQGMLYAPGRIISVGGNWDNTFCSSCFDDYECTVNFNGGNYDQYCLSNEVFDKLIVNKPLGGNLRVNNGNDGNQVTCSTYNCIAGGVDVITGSFTAYNLTDNAIKGNFYLNNGGLITLGTGNIPIDYKGNIYIYGGTFSLRSAGESQWPGNSNSSITMSGGVLNVFPSGILIVNNPPYTFSSNITGGTIKTLGNFENHRSDFVPNGGKIELYGNGNTYLNMYTGSLRGLTINKSIANSVILGQPATVNDTLTVNLGILQLNNQVLSTGSNININNNGQLIIENGAQLKITGGKELTVANGGTIKVLGTSGANSLVTRNGTNGHFSIQINGNISARYATFEYNHGLNIWATAIVEPSNPFDYCTFRYGTDRFLYFSNSQELMIRGANFPTAPLYNNVWKNNNAGRVNFRDAIGAYAGPAYEQDPYNRIDWTSSQPGLWTGAVSTNWHTAGNWDDLLVPVAATNVTIPTGVTRMPLISTASATCNNLNLNGTLTIHDRSINVGGNLKVNGVLVMNDYLGKLEVQGSVEWYSGSTANILANANIFVYGDWTFSAGSNAQFANGSVLFKGASSKNINTNSITSSFYDVYIEKTGGAIVTFPATSTEPLRAHGLYVEMNAGFVSNALEDLIVTGNFYSLGSLSINAGSLVFQGTDHVLMPNISNYYNHLVFNQAGTVTINQTNTNVLNINGNMTINSGVFASANNTLKVKGNWTNNVGQEAFNEGTGRVIFNSTTPQFCSSEQFNILEIDKAMNLFYNQPGSSISCQTYDWTQGGIWIDVAGSFYAADLADNGIYGDFVLNSNSIELHQDASQSVDLKGNLIINGGEFKVYGGNDQSAWGGNGNANLNMTNGILDFVDQAIAIQDISPYSFISNITGGVIRTKNGFAAQSPGFNPTGGTVELYGIPNCLIVSDNGASFYNLKISKAPLPTSTNLLSSTIKNSLLIDEGLTTINFGNAVNCGGLTIESGGDLRVSSATLKMKNGAAFQVNSGGYLNLGGYEGAKSKLSGINPADHYTFQVNDGAMIETNYTIFENMDGQGIYIAPSATVFGSQPFKDCEFLKGLSGAFPLLSISNNQDLVLENVVFPANTWGGQFNVRKSVNSGSITFINASGTFAGSNFEDDPFNRINWNTGPSGHVLTLNLFLEGLYNGTGMSKAQNATGNQFAGDIADEINIELHHSTPPYSLAGGPYLVGLKTSGSSVIVAEPSLISSYYIVIKHRNSIETWSASPVSFASTTINYSFDLPTKAYGGNLKQMPTGQYAIYGGDVNQDGTVDQNDIDNIYNAANTFTSGYVPTDANGDGIVDAMDMIVTDNNATRFTISMTP